MHSAGLWFMHFQQYFSNIVAVSFIGGGNPSTQRKRPALHKSLYQVHLAMSGIQNILTKINQYQLQERT
jgi:hypothetical protein